ncbi:MAG TPA: hypothetical protein VEP90_23215 [Methylomirabilota bacterium]|nr:hypothetical protein [Methylomirabilota bacterium]
MVKKTHDISVENGKILIKKSHTNSGTPPSPFSMDSKFKISTKGADGSKSKLKKLKTKGGIK